MSFLPQSGRGSYSLIDPELEMLPMLPFLLFLFAASISASSLAISASTIAPREGLCPFRIA